MPQGAMPGGGTAIKNNKSGSLSVYGKKSQSKHSKERYHDIGRIYNYDYSNAGASQYAPSH